MSYESEEIHFHTLGNLYGVFLHCVERFCVKSEGSQKHIMFSLVEAESQGNKNLYLSTKVPDSWYIYIQPFSYEKKKQFQY